MHPNIALPDRAAMRRSAPAPSLGQPGAPGRSSSEPTGASLAPATRTPRDHTDQSMRRVEEDDVAAPASPVARDVGRAWPRPGHRDRHRNRGVIRASPTRERDAAAGELPSPKRVSPRDRPASRVLSPEALYRHIDRLYRAAWALCGSRHDAEDLVQETFLNVLKRPRVLRDGSEIGYLLRALRNTYSSRYRSGAHRRRDRALARKTPLQSMMARSTLARSLRQSRARRPPTATRWSLST